MKAFEISGAFSSVPEGVHQKVLLALKETKRMRHSRRKVSLAVAAALIALVLLTGAAVASSQWGVLDYLFGGAQNATPDTLKKVLPVNQTHTALSVTASIDSILLEGSRVSAGWLFENTTPQAPAYIVVGNATAGDRHILFSGNDGVEYTWLPDPYQYQIHPDAVARLGFTAEIQGGVPNEDFEIVIPISIFRPKGEVEVINRGNYLDAWRQVDYTRIAPVVEEIIARGNMAVAEDGTLLFTKPGPEHQGAVYVGGTPDELSAWGIFLREDMEFVIHIKAGSATEKGVTE